MSLGWRTWLNKLQKSSTCRGKSGCEVAAGADLQFNLPCRIWRLRAGNPPTTWSGLARSTTKSRSCLEDASAAVGNRWLGFQLLEPCLEDFPRPLDVRPCFLGSELRDQGPILMPKWLVLMTKAMVLNQPGLSPPVPDYGGCATSCSSCSCTAKKARLVGFCFPLSFVFNLPLRPSCSYFNASDCSYAEFNFYLFKPDQFLEISD